MRILFDYRPALRVRSGAGEYAHQLVKALLALNSSAGPDRPLDLTVFSSSWKDRLLDTPDLRGAETIDRRVPVRLLNFAWHRLGWPPIETITGLAFDVTHSLHPLLLPAKNAAQIVTIHDLHFLAHPERTRAEIRRDYPRLVGDHARRAARILVPSRFTASEVERQLGVSPGRIAICPPGAPDWTPRDASATSGYILFFGTLEPRKNVGGLLDAYERLLATDNDPTDNGRNGRTSGRGVTPDLVLAGRATDEATAVARSHHSRTAGGMRATHRLRRAGRPPVAVRRGPSAGNAILRGRLRHSGARGDDARRACRRGQSRIAS